MASIGQKIANAFVSVPHEQHAVEHRRKILLAVTSATPRMPDHTSGFFWGELLHPAEVFAAAGWDMDIVSETGSAHPDENSLGKMAAVGDVKKFEDKQFWLHSKLAQMRPAAAVNAAEYAAIYFAGGHGCCVDFPTATNLKTLTARIYEQGGIVGADCHGPAIFDKLMLSTGVPLVQGKMATGFATSAEQAMPGVFEWMKQNRFLTMQEVIQMNGGVWHEHSTNPMGEYVQVDGRLVTGMNPASAKEVANQIIKLLPKEDMHRTHGTGTGVTNTSMVDDKTRHHTGMTTGATTGLAANKMEQRSMEHEKATHTYAGEVAQHSAAGQVFGHPQTAHAGNPLARHPVDATDRTQTQPEAPMQVM